jgi:hypothetical protein
LYWAPKNADTLLAVPIKAAGEDALTTGNFFLLGRKDKDIHEKNQYQQKHSMPPLYETLTIIHTKLSTRK